MELVAIGGLIGVIVGVIVQVREAVAEHRRPAAQRELERLKEEWRHS